LLIAGGTPLDEYVTTDFKYVLAIEKCIASQLTSSKVVVSVVFYYWR